MEVLFPEGTDLLFIKYCLVGLNFVLFMLMIGGIKKSVKKINTYYVIVFGFFYAIVIHSIFLSTEFDESMERALFTLASITTFFFFTHFKHLLVKGIKTVIFLITALILITSNVMILAAPAAAFSGFQGIYLNPNILGFNICILTLPYFYNKAFKEYFQQGKWLTWNNAIALNLVILLILSMARSAMLVLAIISVILLFRYEKNLWRKLRIIGLGVFVTATLFTTTGFFKNLIFKHEGVESVFTTREYLWLSRINGISQRPWRGWGFQVNPTHENYVMYHSSNKLEKGNMYLALLEEFGLILGGIMFLILIYIARMSLGVQDEFFFISLTILGTFVHLHFESWFLNFNSFNAFIFWIYVMFIPSLRKMENS